MTAPASARHTVSVEPGGIRFTADTGEAIMDAALRHGMRWPTTCEGQASCGICYVEVVRGGSNLGPVPDDERERIDDLPARRFTDGELRLACRATCHGDVVVKKKGVRPVTGEGGPA